MVQKCSRCVRLGLVCKVHTASGRCGHCIRSNNAECDVRFGHTEWKTLMKEHDKVVTQRGQAHAARLRAQERLEALANDLRVAQHEWDTTRAREQRLVLQKDLLEKRASETIAVESASLATLDLLPSSSASRALTADEWIALDPPDFSMFLPGVSWSQLEDTVGSFSPHYSRDQEPRAKSRVIPLEVGGIPLEIEGADRH